MPTALELTRKQWQPYIEGARQRKVILELPTSAQHERDRIMALAREASIILKQRFGVKRVLLIGSLAHTTWFMDESDVDLAVEGLRDSDYLKAWGVVEDIIGDRPVDLIEIERAGESLRRAIERYGIEL